MKTKVQEVMTTDVLAANESTPFKEIAELLARQRISAVPVLDDSWVGGARLMIVNWIPRGGYPVHAELALPQQAP